MKIYARFWNFLGVVLFIGGFLLGMLFIGLSVWGDLEGNAFWGLTEAATYDNEIEMDAQLKGMQCPILLTSEETGTVSTRVINPQAETIRVILQTDFSQPLPSFEPVQDVQQFELSSGEQRQFSWPVDIQNLRYQRLILIRTYLIEPVLRVPAQTAHCGILVIQAGNLSSQQIILFILILSLSGMILGIPLWVVGKLPLKNGRSTYSMLALGGATVAGIAAALLGAWVIAGGFFLLNLIILLTMFENIFQGQYVF